MDLPGCWKVHSFNPVDFCGYLSKIGNAAMVFSWLSPELKLKGFGTRILRRAQHKFHGSDGLFRHFTEETVLSVRSVYPARCISKMHSEACGVYKKGGLSSFLEKP